MLVGAEARGTLDRWTLRRVDAVAEEEGIWGGFDGVVYDEVEALWDPLRWDKCYDTSTSWREIHFVCPRAEKWMRYSC